MKYQTRKPPEEFTVEQLDRELIVRGVEALDKKEFQFTDGTGVPELDAVMKEVKELYKIAKTWPRNEALRDLNTDDLVKKLLFMTGRIDVNGERGIHGKDERKDFHEITDEHIRKNANCTATICLKDNFTAKKKGFSDLKTKNYGDTFRLSLSEPFHFQPIAAGSICTGFLVKEDVVATAAHFANETNVTDLRIIFDYKIVDTSLPDARYPNDNIYHGVEIIQRVHERKRDRPDWALVRLDRKVAGQSIAALSREPISCGQAVYAIGYPCGLPLKYAPGATVCNITEACFGANLDIFMGNSGSPVFRCDTHEVIGMVVRGDNQDLRWTENGWISIIYPNREIFSEGYRNSLILSINFEK